MASKAPLPRDTRSIGPSLIFPTLWIVGAVAVWWTMPEYGGVAPSDARGALYVVSHDIYKVSLPVAFGVFAALYTVIIWTRSPFQRGFAVGHFGLMSAGTFLICLPSLLLRGAWIGMPRRSGDPAEIFGLLNGLSTAGYALTLLGLLTFVVGAVQAVWIRITGARARSPG